MKVQTFADIIEEWAPRGIAWERDNIGLQIGEPSDNVRGILFCLDVTPRVIDEAVKRQANLIFSHHPLLFKRVRNVSDGSPVNECLRRAVRRRINIFSAHTNLDFTRGGTSFALAESLGLIRVDFLMKSYKTLRKVVTYVPGSHVDAVASAMSVAGAGRIGNYDYCSFRSKGIGTFRGNEEARPLTGRKGRIEKTDELRLEMVANDWQTENVVRAMIRAHPYEEVAYEIYPMENTTNEYGLGTIGTLRQSMTLVNFLKLVKRKLGTDGLRYAGKGMHKVRVIALCGGSGADLLPEAIGRKADVFVTADVKYHSFQEANGRIALVDAGHFETEFPVINAAAKRIRLELKRRGTTLPVFVSRISTNPVMYL